MCSIPTCDVLAVARTWCHRHWKLWRRHGDPQGGKSNLKGLSAIQRFWLQIDKTDTCWLWTGNRTRLGYALFRNEFGNKEAVHVFAYRTLKEPIPAGLEIDHLCKVRHCANPQHLEAVTRQENIRRSDCPAGLHARKTHCIHGHKFSPQNTYIREHGRRRCKTCTLRARQENRARRKQREQIKSAT